MPYIKLQNCFCFHFIFSFPFSPPFGVPISIQFCVAFFSHQHLVIQSHSRIGFKALNLYMYAMRPHIMLFSLLFLRCMYSFAAAAATIGVASSFFIYTFALAELLLLSICMCLSCFLSFFFLFVCVVFADKHTSWVFVLFKTHFYVHIGYIKRIHIFPKKMLFIPKINRRCSIRFAIGKHVNARRIKAKICVLGACVCVFLA